MLQLTRLRLAADHPKTLGGPAWLTGNRGIAVGQVDQHEDDDHQSPDIAGWFTFDRRRFFAPYITLLTILVCSVAVSGWFLVGLPLWLVGWGSVAPNFNLANGCLPVLTFLVSAIAFAIAGKSNLVFGIGAACWGTWLACSAEVALAIHLWPDKYRARLDMLDRDGGKVAAQLVNAADDAPRRS